MRKGYFLSISAGWELPVIKVLNKALLPFRPLDSHSKNKPRDKKPYMYITRFKAHSNFISCSILSIHYPVLKIPKDAYLYQNLYLLSYTYPHSKSKFQNPYSYQETMWSSTSYTLQKQGCVPPKIIFFHFKRRQAYNP